MALSNLVHVVDSLMRVAGGGACVRTDAERYTKLENRNFKVLLPKARGGAAPPVVVDKRSLPHVMYPSLHQAHAAASSAGSTSGGR